MGIPYYTHYVTHCLKVYMRHNLSGLKKPSAISDWKACDKVFNTLVPEDVELFTTIFQRNTSNDNFSGVVLEVSQERNVNVEYIWHKIRRLEKEIAIERGLYDPT